MSSSPPSTSLSTYNGPPPPAEGQVFQDSENGFWRVQRLTMAPTPVGFYLVHVSYGTSLDQLQDSMVLGPREFGALVRDRNLTPHLDSGAS